MELLISPSRKMDKIWPQTRTRLHWVITALKGAWRFKPSKRQNLRSRAVAHQCEPGPQVFFSHALCPQVSPANPHLPQVIEQPCVIVSQDYVGVLLRIRV